MRPADCLPRLAGPGGTLWVDFSGHGAPAPDGDAWPFGVATNPMPSDLEEGSVRRRTLQRIAADAPTILVLDACFSGKGRDGDAVMGVRFAVPASLAAAPRVVVRTAASGAAYAGPPEGARHGLFTDFAVGALSGWADDDGDGQVRLREAERSVRDHMSLALERAGRRQSPELAAPDEADRWVVAAPGARRGPEEAMLRAALGGVGPAPAPVREAAAPAGARHADANGLRDTGRVPARRVKMLEGARTFASSSRLGGGPA